MASAPDSATGPFEADNGHLHPPPRVPLGFVLLASAPAVLDTGLHIFYWWPHNGWQRGIVQQAALSRSQQGFTHLVSYPLALSTIAQTARGHLLQQSLTTPTYGQRWLALGSTPQRPFDDVSGLPEVLVRAATNGPRLLTSSDLFFQRKAEVAGSSFVPPGAPLEGQRSWAIVPLIADVLGWSAMFPQPRPLRLASPLDEDDPTNLTWDDLVDLVQAALTRFRIGPTWLTPRMSMPQYWPPEVQDGIFILAQTQWNRTRGSTRSHHRLLADRFEDAAVQWLMSARDDDAALIRSPLAGAGPRPIHDASRRATTDARNDKTCAHGGNGSGATTAPAVVTVDSDDDLDTPLCRLRARHHSTPQMSSGNLAASNDSALVRSSSEGALRPIILAGEGGLRPIILTAPIILAVPRAAQCPLCLGNIVPAQPFFSLGCFRGHNCHVSCLVDRLRPLEHCPVCRSSPSPQILQRLLTLGGADALGGRGGSCSTPRSHGISTGASCGNTTGPTSDVRGPGAGSGTARDPPDGGDGAGGDGDEHDDAVGLAFDALVAQSLGSTVGAVGARVPRDRGAGAAPTTPSAPVPDFAAAAASPLNSPAAAPRGVAGALHPVGVPNAPLPPAAAGSPLLQRLR